MSYQVTIIGGGIAGMAAALTLGRSMIKTLLIDAGSPCNRFADHSFNFLTHDGDVPGDIGAAARANVLKYKSVSIVKDAVKDVNKSADGFTVETENQKFASKVVVLATGVKDKLEEANIKNLEQFWGQTVIHCPYCHGFEIAHRKTGIIVNNPALIKEVVPMIYNWSKDIHVFTNGTKLSDLCDDSFSQALRAKSIPVIEDKIAAMEGANGQIESLVLESGKKYAVGGVYMHPPAALPLGDVLTKLGVETDPNTKLIKTNMFQATNVDGLLAAGDCTTLMRSLSVSNYQGMVAGTMTSKQLFAHAWA